MDKISKSIEKISKLSKGFDKDDAYIDTLIAKLDHLENLMLKGLEEDERIKAQKKAS
ncbi:MAG: hypothetical protein AAF960_17395 [Bacteroidota bacterium]